MAGTAEPAPPQPAVGPATPARPTSSADLEWFRLQETAFLEKMSCKMPRNVQQTQTPQRAELGEGHGRRQDALTGGARCSRCRKTPAPALWCSLNTSTPLRSSCSARGFPPVAQALLVVTGTGGVPRWIGRAEQRRVGAVRV